MTAPDLADFAHTGRVARVAVVLVVLAVSVFVAREQLQDPGRLEIAAEFNRAGLNIRAGDEVRMRGIPVGTVERIEVDRRDFSARYVLSLDPGTRVASDSSARVVPKTLLGDKYVELDPAPSEGEVLAAGATIGRDRTATVAELEQVIDRLGTVLDGIDAGALGGAISAVSYGIGDDVALRTATSGFAGLSAAVADSSSDVDRILTSFPDVAATLTARAQDVAATFDHVATLAELLERRDAEVQRALRTNAEFLTRTADLITDPRFVRSISGGLDVLDIVLAHPGAVQEYLQSFPVYLEGVVDAIFIDHLYAMVAHLLAVIPSVDTHDEDGQDGRGAGPDVVIHTPPPEDDPMPVPAQGVSP